MIRIKHSEIADVVKIAEGDFCFMTDHVCNEHQNRWAYSLKLGTYGGAESFLVGTFYQPDRARKTQWGAASVGVSA